MSFGALIEKFRAVALDRIERMNVLLVQLEHDPMDAEATEEILREIHTLKGEAKMMGFADVNLVSHQTEHLLTLITERGFEIPQNVVDVAFEGFDIVRQLLTKSAGASDAPVDLSGFVERVTGARSAAALPSSPPISEVFYEPPSQAPASQFDDLAASLAADSWGESPGASDDFQEGLRPSGGEGSRATSADADDVDRSWAPGGLRRGGHGRSTRARIDASQVATARRDGAGESDDSPSSTSSDRLLRLQVGGSLRVDLEKLERLGDVAGEVLLLSRRLNYGLGELASIRDDLRLWLERLDGVLPIQTVSQLRNVVHRFDDFTSGTREETYLITSRTAQLDEEVRGLRHVPLAQVMSHYPRAVRDLAREQGKRVRLVHAFGNVEVDRTLLSALSEPMLHLIRNAVDHGIESPDERREMGKDQEAMIRLQAEYIGDSIRVVIEDDGRGISPQLLREKAVARGLFSQERAELLSDQEALALIFDAGFTTRDSVSDVSGRGIGMDVVRRQVTEMGGYIEVESEVGEGTSITMILPVSSAVSQVLMVEIGGRQFALAAKQVVRVGAVSRAEIMRSHGAAFVDYDGEMIALADWAQLLIARGEPQPVDTREKLTVLILRRGSQFVAVSVCQVLGEREAMSRPFGDFLRGVRLCRGVALTDAGEVVPLLNVPELLAQSDVTSPRNMATLSTRARSEKPAGAEATATSPGAKESGDNPDFADLAPHAHEDPDTSNYSPQYRVLVVEDSEITRDLVTRILGNHGYQFVIAEDGQMGWELLQQHPVDLVLSDVQMPRMDGLELLSKIRASREFADLPVVMLTTLGDPKDKARALGLGADGYLVKLDFQESDLVEMVRRHLVID